MGFGALRLMLVAIALFVAFCYGDHSTAGIEALLKRRMPKVHNKFFFSLDASSPPPVTTATTNHNGTYDAYTVSNGPKGTIKISGNTQIALATGLRWYLVNKMKVDLYWFIGSRLHLASSCLPRLKESHHGSSTVPWRYHFNTVTFSYTTAFWDWDEWEKQLDWMALHGINLPLAWTGYEKILLDTLQEAGFTESSVLEFLSGPAFQAWNRFGNIQASWGGSLPKVWVNDQFDLGKQIIARMVELGMTPVLPAFTGYVPLDIAKVFPNASFVRGNAWSSGWGDKYTNDTFLNPADPLYPTLQKSFIEKQKQAFGDVTHIYTLDQYNEIEPLSGELKYLSDISNSTMQSLKNADPEAIWMMQGWIFYYQSDFWGKDRIKSYLGGVKDSDMIILDLFSESQPQWQRTESYFGKPWIWCMLHGFGGVMSLYGQVESTIENAVKALSSSPSMVGMGATMEGQEGNEIMYDIMFDQAWSKDKLSSAEYFNHWVAARYTSRTTRKLPQAIYDAWNGLRQTAYNNINLTVATAVPAAIFTKYPVLDGLVDQKGTFSTSIPYDPASLLTHWTHFYRAAVEEPTLWADSAYTFDLADVTRQVFSNAFDGLYREFTAAIKVSNMATAKEKGDSMLAVLEDLDTVLAASGNPHFSLGSWLQSARAWASGAKQSAVADYYEYNARNQVTLWGPNGQINDYAAKEWSGLVKGYHLQRWKIFVDGYLSSSTADDIQKKIMAFESDWQTPGKLRRGESPATGRVDELRPVMDRVIRKWPLLFKRPSN